MDLLSQAKSQADHLRLEVAALGVPAPLTPEQCLNLAARINGYQNWHDLANKQAQRYFYDLHAPYLPNATGLVRALSIRKAALLDLADIEKRSAGQSETQSGQWTVAVAVERALRQSRQALQGAAHLAPELLQALTFGVTQHPLELHQAEENAKLAYAKAATPEPADNRSGLYQAFAASDEKHASVYHSAYVRWRLATMSSALCALCERNNQPAFAALVTGNSDIFTTVGGMLSAPGAKKLSREQEYPARLLGQAVLLTVQTSGSMEPSLRVSTPLELANGEELCTRLLARFPELAFWHAWAELKPYFAPGIDNLIA